MATMVPAAVMPSTMMAATSGCFGRKDHGRAECRGGTKDAELAHDGSFMARRY